MLSVFSFAIDMNPECGLRRLETVILGKLPNFSSALNRMTTLSNLSVSCERKGNNIGKVPDLV